MRFISSVVVAAAVSSSASAGILASAMIDDFSGASSAGLGFARSASPGGPSSVSGGQGLISVGGGFNWLNSDGDLGYNASAFTGLSLKVTGLSTSRIELYMVGSGHSWSAMQVDVTSKVSNGYLWVTFSEIEAGAGIDPGFIASSMATGSGAWGISLTLVDGTDTVSVDDFEFRTSAVPAPGALALLGVAGLVGARRRR